MKAVSGASVDVHHKIFDSGSSRASSDESREAGSVAPLPTSQASFPKMVHKAPLIFEFVLEQGIDIATLADMDAQTMSDMIAKDDKGQLTSIGALIHVSGQCSPCIFNFQKRCKNSWRCLFCHIPHKNEKKKIQQGRRIRLQRREKAMLNGKLPDFEDAETTLQPTQQTPVSTTSEKKPVADFIFSDCLGAKVGTLPETEDAETTSQLTQQAPVSASSAKKLLIDFLFSRCLGDKDGCCSGRCHPAARTKRVTTRSPQLVD